jgi:hypothetical protein
MTVENRITKYWVIPSDESREKAILWICSSAEPTLCFMGFPFLSFFYYFGFYVLKLLLWFPCGFIYSSQDMPETIARFPDQLFRAQVKRSEPHLRFLCHGWCVVLFPWKMLRTELLRDVSYPSDRQPPVINLVQAVETARRHHKLAFKWKDHYWMVWTQKWTDNVLVSIDWKPHCVQAIYFWTLSKCNVPSEFVRSCWIAP